jgi:hypothetical protein
MQIADYMRGYHINGKTNKLEDKSLNLSNVNKKVVDALAKLDSTTTSQSYYRTKSGTAIRDHMADYFVSDAGKVEWQNRMCFLNDS